MSKRHSRGYQKWKQKKKSKRETENWGGGGCSCRQTLLAQELTLRNLLHKVHLLVLDLLRESLELNLSNDFSNHFPLLGRGGGFLLSLTAGMSFLVAAEGFAELRVVATFVVEI